MNSTESSIPGIERWQRASLAVGAVALLLCAALGFRDPVQFFRSYLFAFVFWIGLPLGCSAILTKPLDLAMVYGILARLSGQQRTTPRVPVKLRVEIQEGTPEKALTCVNLSEGGLYLRTLAPLPEGRILHIKFTLPHDTIPIEVAAKVVRTLSLGAQFEAEPGMGLHFIDMSEDTLLRIRNYVQWEMLGDLDWESPI